MKKIFLILTFISLPVVCLAQIPEWMIIDVQKVMMFDYIKDVFDFNLNDQEILELSLGENGTIWWTTQNYKIKYLPNNFVIYSKYDLTNPLYFFSVDLFSFIYYSRIYKAYIGISDNKNTWLKYNDPSSYEYALWSKDEYSRKKYFETYQLNNYTIPLSSEKEIEFADVLSSLWLCDPNLFLELISLEELKKMSNSVFNFDSKIGYKKLLKASTNAERIFDAVKDANDNIWLATGRRLIRYNGEKFFEINIPAFVLEFDRHNNLWIGTTAYNSIGGLVKFDGTNFTFHNSLNSPLPENDGILDLKTDQQGNLWIALKRTGLPDKLESIKIAIYNPAGIDLVNNGILQSLNWTREPIVKNIRSLFYDRIHFQINPQGINDFSKIEFLVNDKIIYCLEKENLPKKNNEINFTHYVSRPDEYLIKVFLYQTENIKTELANVLLNLEFNMWGFFLGQNKPNPFKDCTVIEYGFWEGRLVELRVFDKYLRRVSGASERYVIWLGKPFIFQANNFPNDCYYYYLKENTTGIVESKKMILFNPENIITLPH